MAYRIAGIDVHKKMLAVVVADVEGESEYQFERRQFGTTPDLCPSSAHNRRPAPNGANPGDFWSWLSAFGSGAAGIGEG